MTDGFAYVGITECGCMRAATVDDPKHKKEVKRDVAHFMKWSDHIERVPVEAVRVRLCMADHKPGCPHPNACPEMAKSYVVKPDRLAGGKGDE